MHQQVQRQLMVRFIRIKVNALGTLNIKMASI